MLDDGISHGHHLAPDCKAIYNKSCQKTSSLLNSNCQLVCVKSKVKVLSTDKDAAEDARALTILFSIHLSSGQLLTKNYLHSVQFTDNFSRPASHSNEPEKLKVLHCQTILIGKTIKKKLRAQIGTGIQWILYTTLNLPSLIFALYKS